MWESIQQYPHRENVEPYFRFLKAANRRQSRYFGRLLKGYGQEIDEPYTASPTKPLLKRGLRHLSVGFLRRIIQAIETPSKKPPSSGVRPL